MDIHGTHPAAGMDAPWWQPRSAADHLQDGAGDAVPLDDSRLPFRGLMTFTFILLLAPQYIFPVLQPLRIAFLAIIVTGLALVYNRYIRGLAIIDLSRGGIYPLLIAGWGVITIPLSIWPGGSVSFLMDVYFKSLVVFILLANIVDTREKLTKTAWLLTLIAVPLALTTVKHYLAGEFSGGERIIGYKAGLTANPNDLALMLNLILPFCIALFFHYRKPIVRWLLAAVIGLTAIAVIITFSRAGFLALALMFMIYMWRLRRRPERRFIPAILILALMALPLVPSSYYERLGTITDIEADTTGSAQTRLKDSLVAADYVISHPLIGGGLGMNVIIMNQARGETWTQVHNVYLQLASELGLPGLFLYLIFYRICLQNTRQVLNESKRRGFDDLFYITEAVRISLIVFAVEAFFHPSAYQFYFYYIAGLAVAIKTVMATAAGNVGGNGQGSSSESLSAFSRTRLV